MRRWCILALAGLLLIGQPTAVCLSAEGQEKVGLVWGKAFEGKEVSAAEERAEKSGKSGGYSKVTENKSEKNKKESKENERMRGASDELTGGSGETPVGSGEIPGESGETPGGSGETPEGSGETPGESGETPGESGETPGESGETPGGSGETPGGNEETPGGSGEMPGGSGETPGGSGDVSGENTEEPEGSGDNAGLPEEGELPEEPGTQGEEQKMGPTLPGFGENGLLFLQEELEEEEAEESVLQEDSGSQMNPVYQALGNAEQLKQVPREHGISLMDVSLTEEFSDLESAGAYLKEKMLAREESAELVYYMDRLAVKNTIYDMVYMEATREESSASPEEGDYLWASLLGYSWKSQYSYDSLKSQYVVRMTLTFTYLTDLEQEAYIAGEVSSIAAALPLSGKTQAEKCRILYDYVCGSVNYVPSDIYNPLIEDVIKEENKGKRIYHTAYGALTEHYAVCQGFSMLFFRLCKEAGVPVRFVVSDAHAWDIVQIGGEWYNVDPTWGGGTEKTGYDWFLKNMADFPDHVRAELSNRKLQNDKYPMTIWSYGYTQLCLKQLFAAGGCSLGWQPVPECSGYLLERKKEGESFGPAAECAGNIQEYSDSGLEGGTGYEYRICAFLGEGAQKLVFPYAEPVKFTALQQEAVPITKITFPDPAFREYVLTQLDLDGDGKLSPQEAAAVTKIQADSRGIESLEGLQYFVNLQELNCSGNSLAGFSADGFFSLKKVNAGGNCLYLNSQSVGLKDLKGFETDRSSNWQNAKIDNGKLIIIDSKREASYLYRITDSCSEIFQIAVKDYPVNDIRVSVISHISSQIYTGLALRPAIRVGNGAGWLTPNVDYRTEYRNNVNVGTAQVTVIGIGNYTGVLESSFPVKYRRMEETRITGFKPAMSYTGKYVKQDIAVKRGNLLLQEGRDYRITYLKNRGIGEAVCRIRGMGNYNGIIQKTFKILPPVPNPGKTLGSQKGTFEIQWKPIPGVSGYQFQYTQDASFRKGIQTGTVQGWSRKSRKMTDLTSGKMYYVRMRTFKNVEGGRLYSSFGKSVGIRVK